MGVWHQTRQRPPTWGRLLAAATLGRFAIGRLDSQGILDTQRFAETFLEWATSRGNRGMAETL